jgi:16S rRNA (uracil1498-N3)-methyltransferase
MKLHRFIGQFNLNGNEVAIEDPKIIHQITKVLRLQAGDQVILGNGQGIETIGDIKKIEASTILMTLGKKIQKEEESVVKVSLYLAILKKENFEWVAQKATEIGVSEIIPLHTERVVKQNVNEERLRIIIREAAEQSGRGLVPELLPTMSLEDGLKRAADSEERLFLDETGVSIKGGAEKKSISIFVGPEGGWSDEEKEMALNAECKIIKISPFTLRAETAAIVGSYLAVQKSQ